MEIPPTTSSMPTFPSLEIILAKLAKMGVNLPPGPIRLDGYGNTPEMSESLLALIWSGKKRAGTSLLWALEAENLPLPQVGDIEIVLDHLNEPVIVTRILDVKVVPYGEVNAEYAAIEGEGDGSLAYWRKVHWAFFSRECKLLNVEPSETMPVVCSIFEVLTLLPPPTNTFLT